MQYLDKFMSIVESMEVTHTGVTAIVDVIIWAVFIVLGALIIKDRLFR